MNPHPTRSKSVKIGRKHSGAKSSKNKQQISAGAKKYQKIQRHRARKAAPL